ncbi:hypothetical protein BJV82DRAFT_659658 [Fennellomyces sp. T-0311]|nr:hypothetical protein BJV82DRAFT_659658 [Fennellomyces sp. T-0311]
MLCLRCHVTSAKSYIKVLRSACHFRRLEQVYFFFEMTIRLVALTTNDHAAFVKESLLLFVETIEAWDEAVPDVYGFTRDCRLAIDVIQPIIQSFKGFDEELQRYIEQYEEHEKDNAKDIDDDKKIVKEIVAVIIQTRYNINEFRKAVKGAEERLATENAKAIVSSVTRYKTIRRDIQEKTKRLQDLIILLEKRKNCAKSASDPKLEQFRTRLTPTAFNFWKKHVGETTSTSWDMFAQNYTILFGTHDMLDLKEIKEYLSVTDKGNELMTLYGFITLTEKHGFPFAKNPETMPRHRKKENTDGIRTEVAKMFASKDMQDHFLAIYQWFQGVDRKDTKAIEKRADHWAAVRKASRKLLNDSQKTEEQLEADRVDFARRSISFFYQQYRVLWRVGQPQRDMLSEVDFPGKGRLREFIAFCKPLDYSNFHYVLDLEPERWPTAQPDVYHFLEQLVVDKSKEAK